VAVAAGAYHSLAVTNDGKVWTWGDNTYGQLGNGTVGGSNNQASNVPGFSGAVAVAGGFGHSLALKSDGTVWSWGSNWFGELGNGTHSDSGVAAPVARLAGATAIAAGGYHSLAVGVGVSLAPDPVTLSVGGSTLLTVTISPAQPTPTTVTIACSDPTKVSVPANVVVPANTASATFTATGVGAGSATITVTLPSSLGGASAAVTAHVLAVSLAGASGPAALQVGQTGQGTVTLTGPAPAGGITVGLSAAPGGVVSVPGSVTVPQGQTSAQFPITAVGPGTATVTATFGSTNASFVVAVIEPIPLLSRGGEMILVILLAASALVILRGRFTS
jgi:hypothetical protein